MEGIIHDYLNKSDNSLYEYESFVDKENNENQIYETNIDENNKNICINHKEKIIPKTILPTGQTTNIYNNINSKNIGNNNEINGENEELRNYIDKDKEDENEKSGPNQNKTLLGRKKKNSNHVGKHTKYSEDNVIRKIKAIIISSLKDFINSVISNAYGNNIGKGVFRKELLKMNQSQIVHSKYNREFLNKSLKEIFSEDISTKYNNYQSDRNRRVIEGLLNETDFNKKTLFTNLFDLTFLECVKHIRGENQNNLLNGLASLENLLDNLCEKCENDEEYLELFQYYTNNLETIIGNKRRRKTKSV